MYTQASKVAVSGSYAYVTGADSKSLVVIDISNPATPVIRGSVVSSSLLDHVRVTQSRGARMASGAALVSRHHPSYSRPWRHRLLMLSRALTRSLSRAVHTGFRPRRERLLRLRGGVDVQLAGGSRH